MSNINTKRDVRLRTRAGGRTTYPYSNLFGAFGVLLFGVTVGCYLALEVFVEKATLDQSRSPKTLENQNILSAASFDVPHGQFQSISLSSLGITKNSGIIPGIFVLGMHRSGTSVLAGLLHRGLGYKCPGTQIDRDKWNPYGYHENSHVVAQNDVWLAEQGQMWHSPGAFDPSLSCVSRSEPCAKDRENDYFSHLFTAVMHYNMTRNIPWIVKDPRLCITIHSWIRAFQSRREDPFAPPAIVFVYRDPLEVSHSLRERDNMDLVHGLKLWIRYNQLAIVNSSPLCRIMTSSKSLMEDPVSEMTLINQQLHEKCDLPLQEVNKEVVKKFMNVTLIHTESSASDACHNPARLKQHKMTRAERKMYGVAMTVFCDIENGKALSEDYSWPRV